MHTEIDWMRVRILAAGKGARSDRAIAAATGVHRNSIGREGGFVSATLDALANYLECSPTTLIRVVRDPPDELALDV